MGYARHIAGRQRKCTYLGCIRIATHVLWHAIVNTEKVKSHDRQYL